MCDFLPYIDALRVLTQRVAQHIHAWTVLFQLREAIRKSQTLPVFCVNV